MEMKTTGRSAVEEAPYGMYVWELPGGDFVANEDGDVMNVFCMKGDTKSIKALTDAARYYGYNEGRPAWLSGRRRISAEEEEMQMERERMGLIPDPLDYGAIREEWAELKRNGK